ncbi:MAG: hypothetical protein IAF00_03395 [Phycisphaerales bacterium]|nr:hypothetical protein [Phycisphaerales bacterium]
MRALFHFCFPLGLFLWLSPAPAARPAPEEFIAPLQTTSAPTHLKSEGSSGQVRTIRDKLTGKQALQAGTAKTAITAAIKQRVPGCHMIRYKGGFGWVVTGAAHYPAIDNPVTIRRTRQEARFKAFLDARTRLADCLRNLTPEAQQRITQSLETDDAIQLALINLATNEQERQQQVLKILARGFVAYSSEEDTASHTIYVNLVTTPKTATRLTRPASTAMETVALKEGLRQLLAEVEGRLIPPAGNRLIVVNSTGELALVGYAVNLIGVHPESAIQEKLRADAEKIATAHAIEALAGLIAGDDATWITGLDSASQAEVQADASGYSEEESSVRRFAQIRELTMSGIKTDAALQALREGHPSPEIVIKQFMGEDNVAVAVVYTPAVKKREPPPRPSVPKPVVTSPSPAPESTPIVSEPAPATPPSTTPKSTPVSPPSTAPEPVPASSPTIAKPASDLAPTMPKPADSKPTPADIR